MVDMEPQSTRHQMHADVVTFYPRDRCEIPPHGRLGLPPHATPAQIKGAYKKISVHLHPDKNK